MNTPTTHDSRETADAVPSAQPAQVPLSPARPLLRGVLLAGLGAGSLLFVWWQPFEFLASLLPACLPLAFLFPGVWWRRSEPPPAAWGDLEHRRPAWRALSNLFLDTELDAQDHTRLASVLAHTGYTADQLEEILYCELQCVLVFNFLSGAGEWAGFDPQWLEERVLRRAPGPRAFAIVPGKWMVREHWRAIRAELCATRTRLR